MFAAVFLSVALVCLSVYLLGPKKLHPLRIAFVWISVVCMDEIFYTLMLTNWKLYDVSGRMDEWMVRLVNLDIVTPIIVLLGLEAAARVPKPGVRVAIGIATAAAMFAVDAFLIRSGVIRATEGFRWAIQAAEEAFLVAISYVALAGMGALMQKDGVGYERFR